jgi:hypothetical protein
MKIRTAVMSALGVALLAVAAFAASYSAEAAPIQPPQVEPTVLEDIVYTGCGSTLGGGGQTLAAAGATVTSPGICVTYCNTDPDTAELVCPGQPANIAFLPSPANARCGSIEIITVTVTDSRGAYQVDGLPVTFSTTLGVITTDVGVNGGTAVARWTVPSRQSGVAEIRVTAGRVSATKTVPVSC